MTKEQAIAYGPVAAIILVLAVFFILIDARIWGHSQAIEATIAKASPTPIIIVVGTSTPVSLEAQLGGLRNQASGALPSFADFRAEMAPVPANTPAPIVEVPLPENTLIRDIYLPNPQGATMAYRLITLNGNRWFETPDGQVGCGDVVAGTVQHWQEWPDWMRGHMTTICMGA